MKESFFTGRVGLQSPSAKMRLALIFVLSVITPIILQAQNSTTNGDAIQTQGTSNRIPSDIQGLTPDLLAKLLTKVSEIGADKDFPGFLASVLGLTKPDASWAMRQIVVKETTSDTYHEFAVSRTGDPDMLFISRHGHGMIAFRINKLGAIVSSLRFDPFAKSITVPKDHSELAPDFAAECAFWKIHVDDISTIN